MASETPSRGGVAGMFRIRRLHCSRPRNQRQRQPPAAATSSEAPGASSRPCSMAVHGHSELATMANVVVANTELQKKLQQAVCDTVVEASVLRLNANNETQKGMRESQRDRGCSVQQPRATVESTPWPVCCSRLAEAERMIRLGTFRNVTAGWPRYCG